MARDAKYSLGIWALSETVDRFCWHGYRDHVETRHQFELAATIEGLDGLILQCPNVVNKDNVAEIKALAQGAGLAISAVDVNLYQKEFKWGAMSNADPKVRRQAVDVMKLTMDVAADLGCNTVGLWLGQDGFDYPFQENYLEVWDRLCESVSLCADHNPRVRICVEPKVAEPRGYIFLGNVGKALALCLDVAKDNVGAICDIGHVYMSRENPAEAATFLAKHGKLFSIHFNDARGYFDDDLMAGSVHIWDTIEFLYYMEQVGYDDWYGFDIFPYREDLKRAAELCIRNVRDLRAIALKIDPKELKRRQSSGDAMATQEYLRELLFGGIR
ncbi:MAG: sugar phosphate isomerase/epimerase family protein [Armatimonadota bacterium]